MTDSVSTCIASAAIFSLGRLSLLKRDEVRHQRRDVGTPLAQRRQEDREGARITRIV
jgi:hypothetical protein